MADVIVRKAPAPLDVAEIRRRTRPLLERHGAREVFVIGSYARGTADGWSDVDLVVVVSTSEPFVERPLALGDVVDALGVAVDLLVYTPEEFERGMERGFGIFDRIRREGIRIS